jgi:hypothetical protein
MSAAIRFAHEAYLTVQKVVQGRTARRGLSQLHSTTRRKDGGATVSNSLYINGI